MSSAAEEHLLYQINNAPVRDYPYPHIYVENVFPASFYAQLRANWPDSSCLTSLSDTGRVSKGRYEQRFVMPLEVAEVGKLQEERRAFWMEFGNWFMGDRFLVAMIRKFDRYVWNRFGKDRPYCQFRADCLLVRDMAHYSIGPHTDAPHRLLSMLFYCPDDDRRKHLGTSIYVPLDPSFRSEGGPHHAFDKFRKVTTMEYKPNSLFAFFKTDTSFHGVDPIVDEDVQRDLMLYDIRVVNPRAAKNSATRRFTSKFALNMLARLLGSRSH